MGEEASTWEFVRTRMAVPGVAAAYGYFVDGAAPGMHRGMPSQSLTVVISLDEPVRSAVDPDAWRRRRLTSNDIVLGGLHTAPALVYQPVRQRGVQLAVHPLAAPRLFGVRAAELGGSISEGEDVLGPEVRRLRERLHELSTWQERFTAIEDFLRVGTDDRRRGARPRQEIAAAWESLAKTRGTRSVAELARDTCLSTRQLSTLFDRELGISPKTLANLMRFEHALGLLGDRVRAREAPELAAIAQRCGFYDQAHLAREFRRFAGASPSRFVADELRNIQAGGHRSTADWEL
jgi:AraC-like DNA-binding protein